MPPLALAQPLPVPPAVAGSPQAAPKLQRSRSYAALYPPPFAATTGSQGNANAAIAYYQTDVDAIAAAAGGGGAAQQPATTCSEAACDGCNGFGSVGFGGSNGFGGGGDDAAQGASAAPPASAVAAQAEAAAAHLDTYFALLPPDNQVCKFCQSGQIDPYL